jgi:dCMP deaminase
MRPDWDSYFLAIAFLTRLRSNCIKRKVGSIVVKNNVVVGLGYNGTPKNTTNCFENGCERCNSQHSQKLSQPSNSFQGVDIDKCICLHAELNAILASNSNIEGSTLYSTLEPCINCAKAIVQCGIKKVVFINHYEHTNRLITQQLYQQAKVQTIQIPINIDTIVSWELEQIGS